jgi:hypothetical protein
MHEGAITYKYFSVNVLIFTENYFHANCVCWSMKPAFGVALQTKLYIKILLPSHKLRAVLNAWFSLRNDFTSLRRYEIWSLRPHSDEQSTFLNSSVAILGSFSWFRASFLEIILFRCQDNELPFASQKNTFLPKHHPSSNHRQNPAKTCCDLTKSCTVFNVNQKCFCSPSGDAEILQYKLGVKSTHC